MSETLQPEEAQREAEIRAKLPGDVVALIDAGKTDPGAPFEPAAVAILSKLRTEGPASWQRARAMFKAIQGVTIGDLDRVTMPAGESGDGNQGQPIEWNDPDPWPEPVDGAALLSDISAFIRRHVFLPDELADTVTLWIAVTWIHDRLEEVSPLLNLTSATKRCGKSLLLEVLGEFVYRPLTAGGKVTPAVLFRVIESAAPTVMLDEADTYLRDDDELRGVVNGSQRRSSAFILRSVGDDHEPRQFVTWCPKVISGIGGLPDTVLDRSIVVRLERRPPNITLTSWRDRDRNAVDDMRRKLARWIGDNGTAIVAGLPAVEFPTGLHDRARDAWESLFANGNVAGGEWAGQGGRAWRACERVMASTAGEETGAREILIADLRTIFEVEGWPEALGSQAILDKLIAMEGRRWCEWSRGKQLSAHGLSKLLKPFGVQPRQMRLPDGQNRKGYRLDDLRSLFAAYPTDPPTPPGADPKHRNSAMKQGVSCDPETKHGEGAVSDLNRTKPHETRNCFDVSDFQPPSRGNGADSAPAPVSLPKQPPDTERAGDAYRRLRDGE